MKILTVGASPYLLTKLGKMNRDILCYFKDQGHQVGGAVWHLDVSWFSPDKEGRFFFEQDGKTICDLFPFAYLVDQSSAQMYEIMKKFQPDVVISIGNYYEVAGIYPIKSMYPHLFSWIGIFTIDALPINENMKEIFEHVDYSFVTTRRAHEEIKKIVCNDSEYCPYGPDHEHFYPIIGLRDDNLRVMSASKNSQAANLGCFIKGVAESEEGISGYLHSNIYDIGDYDIHLLIDRFGAEGKIKLPERFVGMNDGYCLEEMNIEYNKSDVIVDVSVKSSTGLSVLEAMSTGCVPVCSAAGALEEILDEMPAEYKFVVPSYDFVGEKEEYFSVAFIEGLTKILNNLYYIKTAEPDKFAEMSKKCIEVAKKFSNKNLLKKVEEIIKEKVKSKSKITVENLV